jgi:hypothetical protein
LIERIFSAALGQINFFLICFDFLYEVELIFLQLDLLLNERVQLLFKLGGLAGKNLV